MLNKKSEAIKNLLKKVAEVKKGELDLSASEDLSVALMNLIAIEEHFFFTGTKTQKTNYFELLDQTRKIRKELLKKLIKNPEGENWCISKHLLAASMRLIEVGTKYYASGKKKEAEDLYTKAYQLYSLFWGINLNVIDLKGVKKIGTDQLNKDDVHKTDFLGKLGELVKKVVDCCIE